MTDYFGFSMAAMNETGSVFASPRKGEKSPSTILYRPFSSWASNSEVAFIHIDIRAAHMQTYYDCPCATIFANPDTLHAWCSGQCAFLLRRRPKLLLLA